MVDDRVFLKTGAALLKARAPHGFEKLQLRFNNGQDSQDLLVLFEMLYHSLLFLYGLL